MLFRRTLPQGWTPGWTGPERPNVPSGGKFIAAIFSSGVSGSQARLSSHIHDPGQAAVVRPRERQLQTSATAGRNQHQIILVLPFTFLSSFAPNLE